MSLNCQRHLFSMDEDLTYLNCAYMSPLMKQVEEAGIRGVRAKRSPQLIKPDHFFEESETLREAFAQLIHAPDPKQCVIIPSVSYGMATVARNLPLNSGDEIIVAGEQFPSNVYPWRRLAEDHGATIITIPLPEAFEGRGRKWNEAILDAITERTALVSLGHIHWADGTLFDLKAIRSKSREAGAWMTIDGTQSVGALPFDVQELQPDALVVAGYKWMMGPYSIGMAYFSEAFNEGVPLEENWINRYESQKFSNLVNYNDSYQPGALRHEVGEHSNFTLVPMLLAAIRQLNEWGPQHIQDYCRRITAPAVSRLREAGFLIEEDHHRSHHLFGIRLGADHDMEAIQTRLSEAKVLVSYRGDSIRVSPNIYNTEEEMGLLADLLTS